MSVRDKPIAPASPWQNGFAERVIGSIRRGCVDHIIVSACVGFLKKYADYYNGVGARRSLNKDAPVSRQVPRSGVMTSHAILGELHRHYVGFKFRYTQVLEGIEWSVLSSCELDCHPRPKTRNAHATISTVRGIKTIIMIGPKIMPYQRAGEPSHQPQIKP